MKPQQIKRIRRVISGQATDVPARFVRSGLRTLEPVYRTITRIRNRSFDRKSGRTTRVSVPVVSIGNLTTGGTGKTPLVCWTVQQLLDAGQQPAIVSRGYGSKDGQPNDEFLELKLRLPDTPHIQNPDRIAAARVAIQQHHANVIVLDDGFQHRRIGRDLDIVLIDATCPFGFGHLLPRGLMREPVESLKRADVVVITRVDQVGEDQVAQIKSQVADWIPQDKIACVRFVPGGWIDCDGDTTGLSNDLRVVAFCGIGNPDGFRRTLNDSSIQVIEFKAFNDHHDYRQSELDQLQTLATECQADALVCTVKDLVKVRSLNRGNLPVLALSIQTEFDSGQEAIARLLSQATQTTEPIERSI